jgi:alpha-1,6-mannosyltransferase
VRIAPWRTVYVLGAVLWVALTICSRNFGDRGGPRFIASLTVAGIVYLLAIREFFRGRGPTRFHSGQVRATYRFPRHVVVIALLLAAAWNIEFLRLPAGADDDIHRYVWDGRLQRLGYNPYLVVPSDPAVKALHTSETRNLNNPDLPSPYPPGAQLFFRAVTAIHESTFALKVAFVICEFGIALALLDLLRTSGRDEHLVLAYAWNPLLAIEVAGSGHIDIVGAFLLVISLAALTRGWRSIAALMFGLAVAVKFLPVVLLPLYWKRVRIRDAALAVLVVAILYVPFLNHGRIPIGSLGTYVQTFRFNGPVFAILAHAGASPEALVAVAVLVGLVTAIWLRSVKPERSLDAFVWPMAASLFCAPVVFPWYLLWLLPFLTSASTLPITVWTVSIIPTYVMWHWRALGRPWGALPGWIMLLEYGCVAIAAAVIWLGRVRAPRQAGAVSD